ncbi:MAG: RagB/SusD family nutrient uptake outer membrane protein, partial [Bacteroidota bacterium]
EVYAQIEKDLTEAIPELKLKSEYNAAERFRFAKGTAQALLGKAYLYQEKWSEAATVLGEIISSGEYGLEPNFADVWSIESEFGVESLFETSYVSSEAYDWGNFPWGGGNESNIEAQLQGPRDTYFDVSGSSLNVINGWGFNLPSAKIGEMFVADLEAGNNDSSRYFGTLVSAADFEATGGEVLVSVDDDPAPHDYEGFMRLKYVTRSTTTSDQGVPELNHGINWRIIRYADVLLMAAEANFRAGNIDVAQDQLEQVYRRARGLDESFTITATGDEFWNMLVDERAMELAFEGSRYWDLIRWGMAEAELGDLGFEAGKHELFPIPQNEIIANNAIEQADQNPGYGN